MTIPNITRELKATERNLDRIYQSARAGLRGNSLALAAGFRPTELATLQAVDEMALLAEMQGRADSEREHAELLTAASRGGDAKASLAILQHAHGWTSRQEITGANGKDLIPVQNLKNLSDSELETLLLIAEKIEGETGNVYAVK